MKVGACVSETFHLHVHPSTMTNNKFNPTPSTPSVSIISPFYQNWPRFCRPHQQIIIPRKNKQFVCPFCGLLSATGFCFVLIRDAQFAISDGHGFTEKCRQISRLDNNEAIEGSFLGIMCDFTDAVYTESKSNLIMELLRSSVIRDRGEFTSIGSV